MRSALPCFTPSTPGRWNGFWLRPHALLCTPPGVGRCGWWGGVVGVAGLVFCLRLCFGPQAPSPPRSLPNPSHQGEVGQCWGWGARGSGCPLSRRFPLRGTPPRFCYLLAPTWQGAWEDGVILGCTRRAWRVCRGSSPVVCSLSRRARRVVRETLRLPVCRVHPDCPWAPQRPGWDSSTPGAAVPRAQALCAGHLPPGPRLSALGILMRSFPHSCDADLILLYLP